eukprot:NODE_502_length_7546_cov_0.138982.p7 type:complete len:140 gc:universal NODE_502_length_7546_cov_0.138982:2384-1965(-)
MSANVFLRCALTNLVKSSVCFKSSTLFLEAGEGIVADDIALLRSNEMYSCILLLINISEVSPGDLDALDVSILPMPGKFKLLKISILLICLLGLSTVVEIVMSVCLRNIPVGAISEMASCVRRKDLIYDIVSGMIPFII